MASETKNLYWQCFKSKFNGHRISCQLERVLNFFPFDYLKNIQVKAICVCMLLHVIYTFWCDGWGKKGYGVLTL